jgi:hypothetical protein
LSCYKETISRHASYRLHSLPDDKQAMLWCIVIILERTVVYNKRHGLFLGYPSPLRGKRPLRHTKPAPSSTKPIQSRSSTTVTSKHEAGVHNARCPIFDHVPLSFAPARGMCLTSVHSLTAGRSSLRLGYFDACLRYNTLSTVVKSFDRRDCRGGYCLRSTGCPKRLLVK